jgi:hypothetical protein
MTKRLAIALVFVPAVAFAQATAGQTPPRPTASVNTQPRVDVLGMARPIEMHDSVWIEDLTMMEVRDLIKGGKTTAVILTGGIEENGPYLTTGKHNNVLRVMGDPIARGLGNALIAPIVTLEPGNPERIRTPARCSCRRRPTRRAVRALSTGENPRDQEDTFFQKGSSGLLLANPAA